MAQARVKGYVVGYDISAGTVRWTVKVKDPSSAHNGKKFPVASCGPGTMLTVGGVDATFLIEPCQVGGEVVLKAEDVRFLDDVQAGQSPKQSPESGENINIMVTEISGERRVWLTGCQTRDQAADMLSGPEVLVEFLTFDIEEHNADDDVVVMFDCIKAITYMTPGAEALEKLLQAVYKLGLKGMNDENSSV